MIKDAIINVSSPAHRAIVCVEAFRVSLRPRPAQQRRNHEFLLTRLSHIAQGQSRQQVSISLFGIYAFFGVFVFWAQVEIRMLICRSRYSRVALKKYVKANNKVSATDAMFDSLFNKALKAGVEKGEFSQPKGMLHHFTF